MSVNADWAARQGGIAAFLSSMRDLVDIVAVEQTLLATDWDAIVAAWPIERLCVWTVNDAERMRFWIGRGVGNLTSDSPHLALEARADLVS